VLIKCSLLSVQCRRVSEQCKASTAPKEPPALLSRKLHTLSLRLFTSVKASAISSYVLESGQKASSQSNNSETRSGQKKSSEGSVGHQFEAQDPVGCFRSVHKVCSNCQCVASVVLACSR
jgi:hypothetical protein